MSPLCFLRLISSFGCRNYDAYSRMKEICSYKHVLSSIYSAYSFEFRYKYMHTCPTELAKLAEEKGMEIAALE